MVSGTQTCSDPHDHNFYCIAGHEKALKTGCCCWWYKRVWVMKQKLTWTDAEYETDTNEEHEAEEFVAKNSIEGKNFLDHLTNYFNIHCKKWKCCTNTFCGVKFVHGVLQHPRVSYQHENSSSPLNLKHVPPPMMVAGLKKANFRLKKVGFLQWDHIYLFVSWLYIALGLNNTTRTFVITVECHLSEHVGTEGCSDNRNVRIIDGLTYDIVNSQHCTHASHLLHLYSPFTVNYT